MHRIRTTLVLAFVMVIAAAATATSAGAAPKRDTGPATYTVTIENLTDGQYLTPPNWATHSAADSVFSISRPASAGVAAVAENGGVPTLAAELSAALDQTGAGDSGVGASAPIPPGGSVTFHITTDQDRISVVSMLICTNDGFAGLDTKKLPTRDGQTKSFNLQGYDAGTELNTERNADIVPAPFCDGDGAGTGESNPDLAENGVITHHRGIVGSGDLDAGFDWNGPVARITVTR